MNNELLKYIKEIEPINDRIMTLTINSKIPITFILVYAHTAEATQRRAKHSARGCEYVMESIDDVTDKK